MSEPSKKQIALLAPIEQAYLLMADQINNKTEEQLKELRDAAAAFTQSNCEASQYRAARAIHPLIEERLSWADKIRKQIPADPSFEARP